MSERKKIENRIFWTSDERRAVAQAIATRMIQEGDRYPFVRGRFAELLKACQIAMLPANRRRGTTVIVAFKDIEELAGKFWAEALAKIEADKEAAKIEAARIEREQFQAQEQRLLDEAAARIPPPSPDKLGALLATHIFASPFVQSLLDTLVQQARAEIAARLSQDTAAPAPATNGKKATVSQISASPQAIRKPRIVIVAANGTQQTRINNDFGKVFDLRYIQSDGGARTEHFDVCKDADATLLMTRFISHSHQTLAARAAGDKLVRINGGITEIERWLAREAGREGPQAAAL